MTKFIRILILTLMSCSVYATGSGFQLPDSVLLADSSILPVELPARSASLEYDIAGEKVKAFISTFENNYPVQLGAFRLKLNADAFYREVVDRIDRKAIMIRENGFYKIRITGSPVPGKSGGKEQVKQSVKNEGQIQDTIRIENPGPTVMSAEDSTSSGFSAKEPVLSSDQTGEKHIIFIGNDNPWIKRVHYFGKSIAFVNALIITIIASIATMLTLLIIILMNRRRMEREARLHQYLLEKYQGLIVDYLFGTASPDDFRPIASDSYRRQVLIDEMIDVSINLKGEEAKKLLGLYKHLGLDRDSIARARSLQWHKKIKGFRELAFMNITDGNDAIYKALNSSNEILRMEAQIALVRLSDKDPFEFLSHLLRPFSLWEQITLHELLIQHNIQVPSFSKWLTSPNPTVVMFALRMIREFKQKDAEDGVRQALMHSDPLVRQLAVQVAGDMEFRSNLETMKRMYKNQEYSVCLEIVKAMGKMPDLSMLGFLKLVLDKEDDVQLQIEATKAIENNGEEGVKTLVKLMKSEYKNYNIIVRHVLDRRIF